MALWHTPPSLRNILQKSLFDIWSNFVFQKETLLGVNTWFDQHGNNNGYEQLSKAGAVRI
jgi:hypothetical protein